MQDARHTNESQREQARRAHAEVSARIWRTMLTLIAFCFFCLISLGEPDSSLIVDAPTITLPFADVPVSFLAFITVTGLIFIVLLIYLHLFVSQWRKLDGALGDSDWEKSQTLFNLDAPLARLLSGFIFYALVPLTMGAMTYKAMARPEFGVALANDTITVTAALLLLGGMRALHTMKTVVRVAGGVAVIAGYAGAVAVITLNSEWFSRPLNLSRSDLRGQFLVQADMPQAFLTMANLEKAVLWRANLREAHLGGANLKEANLMDANLQGADLTLADMEGANMSDADLEGAVLAGANLNRASLIGANLRKTDLSGAKLQKAFLLGATLENVNLENATLYNADLREVKLRGVNLQGAKLAMARLFGADLGGATLSDADLREADLHRANLQEAVLFGAQLTKTRLRNANLREADLRLANLEEADLTHANMEGADLRGAYLRGTDFSGANLQGADLRMMTTVDLDRMVDLARMKDPTFRGMGAELTHSLIRSANNEGVKWPTCEQITGAEHWEESYRDPDLACGAPLPEKMTDDEDAPMLQR